MLNWWLGRPVEGKYVQDGPSEPPETPAPVFAARALKEAIFGQPDLNDDTIYDIEADAQARASREAAKAQSRSTSPTKPPGILMTPGTAGGKRKTVSFGNEVLDRKDEKKEPVRIGKSGLPDDCPGKFPSPWSTKSESKLVRKTHLTKVLENSREGKPPRATPEGAKSSFELEPLLDEPAVGTTEPKATALQANDGNADRLESRRVRRSSSEVKAGSSQPPTQHRNLDSDHTVDLNDPHSQSGKFWKAQYDKYHEEAKAEMVQLTHYKEAAKRYAKFKDDEATALAERLIEEQMKVTRMESRLFKLSAKIASTASDQPDETAEMVKELARQTALTVQYQAQVEEFRKAIDSSGRRTSKTTTQRSSKELTTENVSRTIQQDSKEVDSLRDEVRQLQRNMKTLEEKLLKLHDENAKITQELLHADLRHATHLESCEKKRQSLDAQLLRKEERIQNLQKDCDSLRDASKASRRDSEKLLKQKHDQNVELRKELASLRAAEVTAKELQRELVNKSLAHQEVVSHPQMQSEKVYESRRRFTDNENDMEAKSKHDDNGQETRKERALSETPHKRESQIPVSTSISRPSKVLPSSKSSRSETTLDTPQARSSHRPLLEIVNGASVDTIPPEGCGPVQHTPAPTQSTPLNTRFRSISPETPELQLPSPEPSILPHIGGRAIHERTCHASPRPSMFNIASSPPRAAVVRLRAGAPHELRKQPSSNNLAVHRHTSVLSSQSMSTDVSRARREVPPERAAAAKARLEQRKKAKKAEAQKENIRA